MEMVRTTQQSGGVVGVSITRYCEHSSKMQCVVNGDVIRGFPDSPLGVHWAQTACGVCECQLQSGHRGQRTKM